MQDELTNCVLSLFSLLFSSSTDKTVGVWDSETGERIKRLKGHTSFVNTCFPARRGPQLVCTGSDDGTVKVRLPASHWTLSCTKITSCSVGCDPLFGVGGFTRSPFSGHNLDCFGKPPMAVWFAVASLYEMLLVYIMKHFSLCSCFCLIRVLDTVVVVGHP